MTDVRQPRRVIVMIGGNGSNLQALIDHEAHRKHYDIVGVISHRPDAFGLSRAAKANIPTAVVDHKQFEDREAFETALLAAIQDWQPDWIVLAGFMRVLSPLFIAAYPNKILNIHPALLPKYKGLYTHQRALAAGETVHGATVHCVTEALDGGPIILQRSVPVFANDTEETLAARVLKIEHQLYPKVVSLAAQGRLHFAEECVSIREVV